MRGVCFHWKLTTDLLFFIFLKKIKVDTHFLFFFLFCFFIFLCQEKKRKSNIGFHISEKKKKNWTYIFIFHVRLFRKNINVEANCQFLFSIFYIEKKENLTQILIFQLMTLTYTHLSCFLNYIWQRCRCIYLYFIFHIQMFFLVNFQYVANILYLKIRESSYSA